jgi:hypothetical protein
MATGTFKWFAQALHDLGNKIHDMDGDDIRFGLVTTATVPAVNTAAPHWGGTGTTNFASTQIATATSYTGPIALTSESWTANSTGAVFDAADPSVIAQDAGGATNIAYAIFYNNTDANKRALGYLEISAAGTVSLVTGSLTINFNASGVLSLAQS